MTIAYLTKCKCGGQAAVCQTSMGSYVICPDCGAMTARYKSQAGALEEWREMARRTTEDEKANAQD